jgi:hypothetical protein
VVKVHVGGSPAPLALVILLGFDVTLVILTEVKIH